MNWQSLLKSYDERRDIIIPGNAVKTIDFSVDQFIEIANDSISKNKIFTVALSGGSTPKKIYEKLSDSQHSKLIDWNSVFLFWSDERSVGKDHPDSNYHMAMKAGFENLPIPQEQIFRMNGENDIEKNAKIYEELIIQKVPGKSFDLIMLGMGEDGHTASLFPQTHGLHTNESLAIANFIPQLHTWRMTLTFDCINQAKNTIVYVIGKSKAEMLAKVLNAPYEPDVLPAQRLGTEKNKALWIADQAAAYLLDNNNMIE